MSRAFLPVDWLESSSIGLSGGFLEVPFVIEIDTAGDDPYSPLLAACPYGSELRAVSGVPVDIARRFSGMVSTEYGFPRILNETTYRALVTYGPISDRTIGLWRRSVRFASETRQLVWSLPEVDASGNYTQINGVVVGKPKRVGTNEYKPLPENSQSEYAAGDGPTFPVERTDNFLDANYPVNDGITAIVYDILVPQLTAKQVREISSFKWHTNKTPFLGYSNWTLIFSNWEAHDEVILIPGSRPIPQWFSHVSVEILFKPKVKDLNPYGWRAVVMPDVFKFDNGNTRPVFKRDGANYIPSVHTFVQYPQVDFHSLFTMFNSGLPGN